MNDEPLSERERQIAAKAWEEGFEAGRVNDEQGADWTQFIPGVRNPYYRRAEDRNG